MNAVRHCIVVGAVAIASLSPGAAGAQAPLPEFHPAWNAVCAMGRNLDQGCEAIRGRTIVDASQYPWSAIGRLNFAGYDTRMHCTGALVAERVVLTAAHCLYDETRGMWIAPDDLHFLAGYQRGEHVAHSIVARYHVPPSYVPDDPTVLSARADWALLELAEPIGSVAGYVGLMTISNETLAGAIRAGGVIELAGYSGLRPHVLSVDEDCGGLVLLDELGVLVAHRCAMMHGDSGGPVLLVRDGTAVVVATNTSIVSLDKELVGLGIAVGNFPKVMLDFVNRESPVAEMLPLVGMAPGR